MTTNLERFLKVIRTEFGSSDQCGEGVFDQCLPLDVQLKGLRGGVHKVTLC